MRKLLHICTILLLSSLLYSCRTHKNTYTHAHVIGIDSVDYKRCEIDWSRFTAVDADIIIKEWTYTREDTTMHREISINLHKRDTICVNSSFVDSFALQSHEIDSVVQVTTKEITTQHRANKWHWWTSLKSFAVFLLVCLAFVGCYRIYKILHI